MKILTHAACRKYLCGGVYFLYHFAGAAMDIAAAQAVFGEMPPVKTEETDNATGR